MDLKYTRDFMRDPYGADTRGDECPSGPEGEAMREFKVYVHYWPKTQSESELWLGYLTSASYAQSKSLFGTFFVCAETRSKAITEAIRRAKESQKALAGRKGASE